MTGGTGYSTVGKFNGHCRRARAPSFLFPWAPPDRRHEGARFAHALVCCRSPILLTPSKDLAARQSPVINVQGKESYDAHRVSII
jgi:hypothetical protein